MEILEGNNEAIILITYLPRRTSNILYRIINSYVRDMGYESQANQLYCK